MLKKLISGALVFGAGIGLFAAPNPNKNFKINSGIPKKLELAYTIRIPGKLQADGTYSMARFSPVYRLPNSEILPNVIKIKTTL